MSAVVARILLWGPAGSGKTTTLQTIHTKLRSELRGELRREPTRLDPTVHYEVLPISLGDVGGVGTQIEIIAVPGADDQVMTRKQLLDQVDGIVLVVDCAPDRIEHNRASIDELRSSLADYGRRLEEVPVVFQYNKRDIADPFAIEELHRQIGLPHAAVFETIATTGNGILASLTTISKHVVRARRNASSAAVLPQSTTPPSSVTREPAIEAATRPVEHERERHPSEVLEAAILAEGEELADGDGLDEPLLPTSPVRMQPDWSSVSQSGDEKPESPLSGELRIVSVGQAEIDREGAVRLPLVLGDDGGRTRSVVLTLRLDPLPMDVGD